MSIDDHVPGSFRHGDEHALRTIYDRYGGVVLHLATRMLGAGPDAEDVVRGTFVAAWAGHTAYDPDRGSVLRWLLDIARRASAEALRVAEKERRSGDGVATLADPASADRVAERLIDEIVVADELARLSQDPRRSLYLAFGERKTAAEIAQVTGIPVEAVRAHLRQGMRELRRRLEVDGATPVHGSLD
jgi:RNA polymerase sigma-70 factor (ECF subfamily)